MAEHGFQTVIIHKGCHDKCETRFVCPECGVQTWAVRTFGRWDSARNGGRGATAIPFDPVAWELFHCGHIFGNYAASQPPGSEADTTDTQPTDQEDQS